MALEITSLSELDQTEVEQARAFAVQLLQEENANIDLRRGVVHDLVIHPQSMFSVATQTNVDRALQSLSLARVLANPALAVDDDLIDYAAGNYLVERKDGSEASGSIVIVLDQEASVTIASGTTFAADGVVFATASSFASRTTTSSVTSTTDRTLTALSDGNYAFTIDVVAAAEGSDGNIVKDTALTPAVVIPYFVKAYAAEDFTGGAAAESNAALMTRLVYGRAAKTLSGRTAMSAALREETAFASTVSDSIVGFGDAEMIRDMHSIFPGATGGRVDWYVRTQARANRVLLTKTATLIDIESATSSIWQVSIDRDDAPGFYYLSSIILNGAANTSGGYAVTSDVRSVDLTALSNDGFLPDIDTAEEGAYSRFQTAVIQFRDTTTVTSALTELSSTQDYDLTAIVMPQISAIQDWASDRDVRNYAGDVLIKAPIPCFLKLSFTIELPQGYATPDTDAIKLALSAAVNGFGFTGRLPAAYLADVIYNHLTTGSYVGAIDMFGAIRKPDQTIRYIRSDSILSVPSDPDSMVTGRTTVFVTEPDDIAISTTVANIPQI